MEPNIVQNDFRPEQQTLFDLQELSIVTTKSISDLFAEIKTLRQMIKDGLQANGGYVEAEATLKEKRESLQQLKKNLQQQTEQAQLLDKMKALREEVKEKTQAASDYALEYERLSGETEFEKDGEVFTIIKTAKLVKRMQ